MDVSLSLDSQAWRNAVDIWAAYAKAEAVSASIEVARAIRNRARQLLAFYPHLYRTKTPAPALIGPVGRIIGAGDRWVIPGWLRNSLDVRLGYEGFDAAAGPTARYARIQELGGRGHNQKRGIPPRPYWIYAHEIVVKGTRADIYYSHWLRAQQLATP